MKYEFDKKKMCDEIEDLFHQYIQPTFCSDRFQFSVDTDEYGFYLRARIMKDSLDDEVATQMYSSTSVIKFSGNGDTTSYERKLIHVIGNSIQEECWINQVLYYISKLGRKERHLLIGKYIMGETDHKIMTDLQIKKTTYYKMKMNAFMHLALAMPNSVRVHAI